MLGACTGFLWWNAAPGPDLHGRHRRRSRIGAGAGLPRRSPPTPSCCCSSSAALFVVETLSVILQVASLPALRRAAHLPHGADPPPLRAAGLARDHGRSSASGSSPACSPRSALGFFYADFLVDPRRASIDAPIRPTGDLAGAACLVVGFGVTGAGHGPGARWPAAATSRGRRPSLGRAQAASRLGAAWNSSKHPTASSGAPSSRASTPCCPTPGLPERHPVFAAPPATPGCRCCSEFDLAAAWDDRPVVAITGTNGKTTVTTLVTDDARGVRVAGPRRVGNTEVPLVDGHRRSRHRRVRGRGVVVPARPQPPLRPGGRRPG